MVLADDVTERSVGERICLFLGENVSTETFACGTVVTRGRTPQVQEPGAQEQLEQEQLELPQPPILTVWW